jgi:hypothetical protein
VWMLERIKRKEPPNKSARIALGALAFGALFVCSVHAQNAPVKGNTDGSSAASGFSIETEMLTYRALESNGEAIACDVAAYFNGATPSFTNSAAGSICAVDTGTTRATVVLLPFDTNEFGDFQIWRADMATMARLHNKATVDCPSESEGTSKSGSSATASKATSVVGSLAGKTPAGPPLALAQSVLALMASEQSTLSVGGTIRDQAFMDSVGRELRELSVSVLMPTAYAPYSFAILDKSTSPFLASLDRILTDRGECLQSLGANEDTQNKKSMQTTNDAKANRTQRVLADIDAFLTTLTQGAVAAPKSTMAQNAKATGGSLAAQGNDGAQSSAVSAAASSSSHLRAVLLADGLAAKLGVDTDMGTLAAARQASLHILLVKALESGGSVTKFSNVFGTTISYSGGSVGTYALFTIDGDLECSGNVYEYGGSLKAKEFQGAFRTYIPDPAKQMVFLRHTCSRPGHVR